jgi:hypothetical protein
VKEDLEIEDLEDEQVKKSYNYMNVLAKNAAEEVGQAYEDAIIALFDDFSQTVGTSAAGIADSNIRRAIQYLDAANAPKENRAFILSAKQVWTDLMAIDKFTLVQNAPGADPVMKGMVGYLYGIPVLMSNRIGTTSGSAQGCLAHKDAIHFATLSLGAGGSKGSMVGSSGVRVQANYVPEYLGTLVTADIVYGVTENRDSAAVKIMTHATKA